MLFVSVLRSERARDPELWATLWNGPAPKGLEIVAVYNLENDTRIFVIEADPPAAIGWMDRPAERGGDADDDAGVRPDAGLARRDGARHRGLLAPHH